MIVCRTLTYHIDYSWIFFSFKDDYFSLPFHCWQLLSYMKSCYGHYRFLSVSIENKCKTSFRYSVSIKILIFRLKWYVINYRDWFLLASHSNWLHVFSLCVCEREHVRSPGGAFHGLVELWRGHTGQTLSTWRACNHPYSLHVISSWARQPQTSLAEHLATCERKLGIQQGIVW